MVEIPAPPEAAAVPTPSVRFEATDVADEGEWWRIADACPYATFFHTPLWLRIFAQTFPGMRAAAKRFRFADGRVAIFPLIENSHLKGLSRTYASTAASCYGGWISADALGDDECAAVADWVRGRCGSLIWRLNPLDPQARILEPCVTESDTTEILHLTDFPDEESLRKHYAHSVRKQVNKGARAGMRASVAERWEEWEAYYAIYRKRIEQWGAAASSFYPVTFFRNLFDAHSPRAKLWVATLEGKLIGGTLTLYHGRHCVEWHAAFDAEYFSSGVRDFLVDGIINDARRGGCLYYDFNPSGGHEGTRRFKQTFGTVSAPASLIVSRRGLYRLDSLRSTYRALIRLRRLASARAAGMGDGPAR